MNWGKTVLIFQAFATIFIGMAFLVQVISLDVQGISELTLEVTDDIIENGEPSDTVIIDLKQRYTIAAYVLMVVALIELLIISRLMDSS